MSSVVSITPQESYYFIVIQVKTSGLIVTSQDAVVKPLTLHSGKNIFSGHAYCIQQSLPLRKCYRTSYSSNARIKSNNIHRNSSFA